VKTRKWKLNFVQKSKKFRNFQIFCVHRYFPLLPVVDYCSFENRNNTAAATTLFLYITTEKRRCCVVFFRAIFSLRKKQNDIEME
jgi:hypothetical protein